MENDVLVIGTKQKDVDLTSIVYQAWALIADTYDPDKEISWCFDDTRQKIEILSPDEINPELEITTAKPKFLEPGILFLSYPNHFASLSKSDPVNWSELQIEYNSKIGFCLLNNNVDFKEFLQAIQVADKVCRENFFKSLVKGLEKKGYEAAKISYKTGDIPDLIDFPTCKAGTCYIKDKSTVNIITKALEYSADWIIVAHNNKTDTWRTSWSNEPQKRDVVIEGVLSIMI